MRGKGSKLGEGIRDFYVNLWSDSGFLRSGILRSGLLRSGKLRGAIFIIIFLEKYLDCKTWSIMSLNSLK